MRDAIKTADGSRYRIVDSGRHGWVVQVKAPGMKAYTFVGEARDREGAERILARELERSGRPGR